MTTLVVTFKNGTIRTFDKWDKWRIKDNEDQFMVIEMVDTFEHIFFVCHWSDISFIEAIDNDKYSK